MKNKELYVDTFSKLYSSKDYLTEVRSMKKARRFYVSKAAVVVAIMVIVLGTSVGAYAANIGGIQRTVQVWIDGEQTDATLTIKDDGSYDLNYRDSEKVPQERSGGGVAIEADGTERNLTEEEILEELNAPEVTYLTDGRVMVVYKNQVLDITDKFNDKVCYVTLKDGHENIYMTIQYKHGYLSSMDKYLAPDKNTNQADEDGTALEDAKKFDKVHGIK